MRAPEPQHAPDGQSASWAPELSAPLGALDPELARLVDAELARQRATLDLTASENLVPAALLEVQGSVLTNKYADGYPGAREYDGCAVVDEVERLAIQRACALFGAEHANVQPYSGSSANFAVLAALAEPGDTVLGWDFSHGGHPTHYDRDTLTGRVYRGVAYHVRRADRLVDMDEVAALARAERPRVIFVGWCCYPRQLDYGAFRAIADEVGAFLVADMAHISGLVAAGLHPSPVGLADVCTFTTHKTLAGGRGGAILSRRALAGRIDAAVYPGSQGGPLPHVIAANALAFGLAARPAFAERMERTLSGARILAAALSAAADETGCTVLSGGTEVHQVILDASGSTRSAAELLERLHDASCDANALPLAYDPRPESGGSGLRLGTAALATRGFDDAAFAELGALLVAALATRGAPRAGELAEQARALTARFPIYPGLRAAALS